MATDKQEAPVSVPATPQSQPISEPHKGNSASESVPAQAESTSNSEIEPGVDTPTTGVRHKYPLRDRENLTVIIVLLVLNHLCVEWCSVL